MKAGHYIGVIAVFCLAQIATCIIIYFVDRELAARYPAKESK